MSRRKVRLKYKKERAILSDVLPYEIPITFSNRHFYDFVLKNKIRFSEKCIEWQSNSEINDWLICLLFGVQDIEKKIKNHNQIKDRKVELNTVSIPFCYKISHKLSEFRELAIPHPRNQIQISDFYHECKELILYYCSISPYSIRQPQKVAQYIYHKDRTHYENLTNEENVIEQQNKEYENLKSFFVYRDYSNIYKFYESYRYHRCEKKYERLLKLDITKCFDSIYTHSLAWAILNKENVKDILSSSSKVIDSTFAGRFDRLMQQINYNETNGIIIGPEFSRIFAELILQAVDKSLHDELKKKGLEHRIDYEIFRYVDDYFIFYSSELAKDQIIEALQLLLKEFKLSLNSNKAITYEKPIITEISRAKQRIATLLGERLVYKFDESVDPGGASIKRGRINIHSRSLITQFKTIVKECDVEYKDMLNYTLAIIERRCNKILKDYHKITPEYRSEKHLVNAIFEILDFVFFIYSAFPRVNTTIKLCRILRIFITFLKSKESNKDFKNQVFKRIFDDISLTLKISKSKEYTQIETLYLLIVLSELGKEYWLDEDVLAEYLKIKEAKEGFIAGRDLNYFTITVSLFYMREKKMYTKLRAFFEEEIVRKFELRKSVLSKDTESSLLLFDALSCPNITRKTKLTILTLHKVPDRLQEDIVKNIEETAWFTDWASFNFGKALDAKQSQEVY